jgi:hypothetical protein
VRRSLGRIGDFLGGRQKQALLDELLRRVESHPSDARVRLKLGDVLQQLERLDEAIDQYREACQLFMRRGFDRQASAARALILRLRPDDAFARRSAQFPTDLDLARQQAPLPREEVRLEGQEEPAPSPPQALPALPAVSALAADGGAPVKDEDLPVVKGAAAEAVAKAPEIDLPDPEPPMIVKIDLPKRPMLTVVESNPKPIEAVIDVSVEAGGKPRERRVEPRVAAEGEVRVWAGEHVASGQIEDLSRTGLFIAGPRLFAAGGIVDLAIKIPGSEWIGTARAIVKRNAAPVKRRPGGLALAFLWTDAPTERWIEDYVRASFGESLPKGASPVKAARDDVRRAHPRTEVDLPIVLRSAEFEVSGWARDLSMGGAFVEAPRVFGAGRRVELLLFLPGGETPHVIPAVVAHDSLPAGDHTRGGGTGIRFIRLTDRTAAAIADLIASEVDTES